MNVVNIVSDIPVLARDIIKSVFNLSKKQLDCFMKILEMNNEGTCIVKLVENMNSERSIIQKYLKILMEKGLVERKAITLSEFKILCDCNGNDELKPTTNKGYLYIYAPISNDSLQSKISDIFKTWDNVVQEFFQKRIEIKQ
jgi:predicted transcriptional regulator